MMGCVMVSSPPRQADGHRGPGGGKPTRVFPGQSVAAAHVEGHTWTELNTRAGGHVPAQRRRAHQRLTRHHFGGEQHGPQWQRAVDGHAHLPSRILGVGFGVGARGWRRGGGITGEGELSVHMEARPRQRACGDAFDRGDLGGRPKAARRNHHFTGDGKGGQAGLGVEVVKRRQLHATHGGGAWQTVASRLQDGHTHFDVCARQQADGDFGFDAPAIASGACAFHAERCDLQFERLSLSRA